jgi:hypothetical protein
MIFSTAIPRRYIGSLGIDVEEEHILVFRQMRDDMRRQILDTLSLGITASRLSSKMSIQQ